MSLTDPIADFITRLRNAARIKQWRVKAPFSKVNEAILKILVAEGFVDNYEKDQSGEISLNLKQVDGVPVLQSIRRISSPGHRIYVRRSHLPRVVNDYGIALISTSKGIMTNREARKRALGGEVICEVS